MLTTSPRIPASANASPSTFHYAPARSSPQSSPSRLSASLTRRHSRSSTSSAQMTSPSLQQQQQPPQQQQPAPTQPAPPRNRQYVAVDAGTQYSPMETAPTPAAAVDMPPHDASAADAPSITSADKLQSSNLHPQPTALTGATSEASSQHQQQPQSAIVVPTPTGPISQQNPSSLLSPGKRRKSQVSNETAQVAAAIAAGEAEASSAAKRPRPAPAPVKILPQRYELGTWEDMVVLIAHMLAELIETNDALALRSGNLTRFHSRTAPSISVLEYLNRLAKHATLSPPLLLSMVYYIDRLCALYPEFTINTLTVHRFLITAATVAAKGLSDSFWNNTTYARVGGVRVAELKLLELEFLYRVDWKIVPNPEVLVAYYRGLVERCPGYALEGDEAIAEGQDDEAEDSTDVSDDAEDESVESPGEGTPATGSSGPGNEA